MHRAAAIATWLIAVCAANISAVSIARADDDTVAALNSTLTKSSSEKQRLAAVISLARIADRSTLKPLVTGLRDPSSKVRAAAAAALGRLGHKAALPALREAANDADELVRKQAMIAVVSVSKANGIALEAVAVAEPAPAVESTASNKPGFGRKPQALPSRPELYVMINTSTDDSSQHSDDKMRKAHGDIVRQAMALSLKSSPAISANNADVDKYGLVARHLDLSVVKLEVKQVAAFIEIEAQLRLAISDKDGKMLSFVSGGAKVSVPKRTFDAKQLPDLRREALEGAVKGLFDKLLDHLRRSARS
jgi:hypothetical protein